MSAGSEVAVRRPQQQASTLPAKLQYAHELANSGLLPSAFRRNPANVLWAMEYADMLGLPPMVAMTGIHVIEGKPTASAGLISGLVRKARHKLRITGDDKHAVAEITRHDDPDFTFRSEWTLERARQAELLGKSNWKKYPAAMLKARAITEAARDACEEALFGLMYTPEELGAEVDEDGDVVDAEVIADPPQQPAAQDDPWYVRPSPEQEWLAKAIEVALEHATVDECTKDWQESVKYVNDGKLTREEVTPLQNRLRARIKALQDAEQEQPAAPAEAAEADVVEGVVVTDHLDPDDPWVLAIRDAVDAVEGERILTDARGQAARDELDPARLTLIEQAIEEYFPGLTTTETAAA